jgi:hypothetical protein
VTGYPDTGFLGSTQSLTSSKMLLHASHAAFPPLNSSKLPPVVYVEKLLVIFYTKAKDVPLHAMKALGGRGGIAPTHSRPRH